MTDKEKYQLLERLVSEFSERGFLSSFSGFCKLIKEAYYSDWIGAEKWGELRMFISSHHEEFFNITWLFKPYDWDLRKAWLNEKLQNC